VSTLPPIDQIRSAFPALAGTAPPARFDGPGGTQVPQVVIDAMTDYLVHHNANTHWNYPASEATDRIVTAARETFAAFLGGERDEVAFGANMTTLTFHVARGLANAWAPGDEVIVTELDHHGNIAPWEAVARERDLVLRWLPMDPEHGTLRLELLPSLLNARTRLLAIGAASNALGTISDVAAAARLARDAGALVYVDAVHYAPHRLLDVHALGADFLACSPYKFYGPHLGVLWGRRELLDRIDTPRLRPAPARAPERVETGTGSFEAIAGAAAAVEWIAGLARSQGSLRERLGLAFRLLHERETGLVAELWQGLGGVAGVRRFGPPPGTARTGTVSFTLERRPSSAVAAALAQRGCWVSDGDFYASTAAQRCGVTDQGWLRVGLAAYTTHAEVVRLIETLTAMTSSATTPGLRSSM
jgi:cysteine desulfurase family protein (TIGR01976 family)